MRALIQAVAFSVVATAAAADGPALYSGSSARAGSYDWSGAYIGFGIGYSRSSTSVNLPGAALPDASGGTLGVLAGYNWHQGNMVFGGEAALTFSSNGGANTCGLGAPNACLISVDNFVAVRARAGYAMDRTLVFMTAGYATDERDIAVSNGIITLTENRRFHGPVIGVGVEHAMSDSLTVRADLEHYFLGSESFGTATASAATSLARISVVRRF